MRPLLLLALTACASSSSLPAVYFMNVPAVEAVNDRRDVPKPPEPTEFVLSLYSFDGHFHRRVTRALELHRHQRARGTNAVDEVPDSTWFTNRVGMRDVSPTDIAAVPGSIGSPEPHKPWTVVSTKLAGKSVGFIIRDARGEKFLLKFDARDYPEVETATQVIIGRLMWAFGFNVTDDYVVYLGKNDLVLAPDAVRISDDGKKRPLSQADLEAGLAQVDVGRDGSIRALASRWLAGKALGGHSVEGVRPDDPNDRIPHELRRDLRGAYALFAWLDYNDIHGGNRLDLWVNDPAEPKRHYVKHYFVDFGSGLGTAALKNREPRWGYEYYVDYGAIARSFFTLGAARRPWEDRKESPLRGVGMLEVDRFRPGTWVPSSAAYIPIDIADRFDKFWAAKIIMRFTRDQIRAAVDAARLSDPRAAAWLTDALIARQRATGRYWFERVNPLDGFAVDERKLCFKDLSIVHAFVRSTTTHYNVTFHDRGHHRFATAQVVAEDSGVTCPSVRLAPDRDGYTIVRIDTVRPAFRGTMFVHIARDPGTDLPRVVGIWRK